MGPELDDKQSPVALLDRIRANPAGHLALKIGVGVVGGLVIAGGIVLIPFPGPGWAIVILGLGILAIEFTWAKRLLQFTRRQVQAWTRWVGNRPWPVRVLIGLACLIVVAAAVWLAVKVSFGVDLVTQARQWLADR